MDKIRVTIWNENWDEVRFENVHKIYPEGIHMAISGFLQKDARLKVQATTPAGDDFGLSQELLDDTDVLIWWGHVIHHLVPQDAVERVCERVLGGMGMISLHSSVYSKPFERLIGKVMNCAYREVGEKERVWVVNPAHSIAWGLKECFEIEHSEVYREPTGLPLPDELVFISWYAGGEAAISGGCYYRGRGRIFVFTPGHEDYPIFYDPSVQQVILNGVLWAYNSYFTTYSSGEVEPYERLDETKLIHVYKIRE